MCGILGEIAYTEHSLVDKDKFMSLLNLSKYRGSDAQGYYSNDKNIQFGFNRLAILDLTENANQPIQSASGRFVMMFNGEIYNHIELRHSLPASKGIFKGNGDTESLIACFDYYGIKQTVKKLNGMFAIVIYDNREKKLYLIRDYAGIKPLFYGFKDGKIVFASQYNQISRHPNFINELVDEKVLKLYFNQHHIPSPYGLIKNTYSVNPGEIVTYDIESRKEIENYWSYPEYNINGEQDSEIIEEVNDELSSAIQDQLLSDVPVGAFLSGGVDSPLICYFVKGIVNNSFNTFSMGSDSAVHNESVMAMKYAKNLGTSHYSTFMNAENSLEALDKAVNSAGEPFGDFSIIPMWHLSELARKKVKVALSGDGADELFFGYERFRSIGKNYRFWNYPYWIRYFIRALDKIIFNEKYVNECILSSNPGQAHMGLHNRFPSDLLQKVAPDLNIVDIPKSYNLYQYYNSKSPNELLYNIRKAEFYGMLQKTLTKVDRASMAHGLEVRVPYLNKSFIEKILKIDIYKHNPLKQRKKFLFKLLNRYYPNIEPEKRKMGFSISLANWIRKDYYNQFREKILDDSFIENFGFKKVEIEQMFSAHLSGQIDYKWSLFSLYSLSVWAEKGRKPV